MSNILLVSATDLEHGESHLYDHEIHIVGVGKASAAAHTAYLINEYNPDVVINFGSLPHGAIRGPKKAYGEFSGWSISSILRSSVDTPNHSQI